MNFFDKKTWNPTEAVRNPFGYEQEYIDHT